MSIEADALAAYIDQTLLGPAVGPAQSMAWVEVNREKGFAALCVPPFLARLVAERLDGGVTKPCSVVAFPLGHGTTHGKAAEAAELVAHGCAEVDMVMNVGALLDGENAFVHRDIEAVVATVDRESGGTGLVKVILETGLLEPADIERACHLAVEAGAQFVKTSTGFGPRGASLDDVRIMRSAVGPDVGVKASGGIRDLNTAEMLIDAGATRIGTSAGADILAEARARETA